MTSLAIYNYGAGNIFSLKNSLEREGVTVHVIDSINNFKYDGILLPGVGNFDPAINSIPGNFLEYVDSTPVLGICLGMEMFFDNSQEGKEKGLGIVPGNVVMLPKSMKIPHMGWNNLKIHKNGILLQDVQDDSWVYFVHSYMASPTNHDIITAESDYGIKIPAVVEYRNYFGTQFHPEKSGDTGKIMIRNFIKECRK